MGTLKRVAIGISCLILLASCSHKKPVSTPPPPVQTTNPTPVDVNAQFPSNSRSLLQPSELENAKIEFGPMALESLEVSEKIRVNLTQAQLKFISTDIKKENSFEIKLLKGNANNCKVKVAKSDKYLTVVEHFNENEKCKFYIEIKLYETVPVEIALGVGSLWASNWDDSILVNIENGDVDFENISSLDITCKECTVAGSGVRETLKYEIGNGNIGVEGLSAAVNGKTSGDTVLKWSKLSFGTNVSVESSSGDIIVGLPHAPPYIFDLKVPNGDVYSSLHPDSIAMLERSPSQNIKYTVISIQAEVGNVRLGY